jgi:hypothetical protein
MILGIPAGFYGSRECINLIDRIWDKQGTSDRIILEEKDPYAGSVGNIACGGF